MAIPQWTWPDDADTNDATDPTDLAAASDDFDALSDPTRAAILGALYDADGPLTYAALQDAVDVPDNGRLNYHLRRLDDLLVDAEDGYALSERGSDIVAALADSNAL